MSQRFESEQWIAAPLPRVFAFFADPANWRLDPQAERFFGNPVSTHRFGDWKILIYDKNVLRDVKPPELGPTN